MCIHSCTSVILNRPYVLRSLYKGESFDHVVSSEVNLVSGSFPTACHPSSVTPHFSLITVTESEEEEQKITNFFGTL